MFGGSKSTLVSLFCGALSVEAQLSCEFDKVICNDKHKYLIAMLNAVKHGYQLPEDVSEEEYHYIKAHQDDDPAKSGFVGFGCAFGGMYFNTYARGGSRNYARDCKNSLLRKMSKLQNAQFICRDYRDVTIPPGAIIYADPPYANTRGYGKEKFDSAAFWDYMRELSKEHIVYISEQTAPEDFVCIWEKPFKRTMCSDPAKRKVVTEKLFTVI